MNTFDVVYYPGDNFTYMDSFMYDWTNSWRRQIHKHISYQNFALVVPELCLFVKESADKQLPMGAYLLYPKYQGYHNVLDLFNPKQNILNNSPIEFDQMKSVFRQMALIVEFSQKKKHRPRSNLP